MSLWQRLRFSHPLSFTFTHITKWKPNTSGKCLHPKWWRELPTNTPHKLHLPISHMSPSNTVEAGTLSEIFLWKFSLSGFSCYKISTTISYTHHRQINNARSEKVTINLYVSSVVSFSYGPFSLKETFQDEWKNYSFMLYFRFLFSLVISILYPVTQLSWNSML